MKLTSFQNQANGQSRFQEVNVPLTLERQDEFGHTLKLSAS